MTQSGDSQTEKIKNQLVCKTCGALIPTHETHCLICGAAANRKKPLPKNEEQDSEKLVAISPSKLYGHRRLLRVVSFVLLLCLLVGGVGAGTFQYLAFQSLKNQYNAKEALIYQQGDSSLKILFSNQPEPVLLRDDYITRFTGLSSFARPLTVKDSFDQRYIAYLNNQRPYLNGVTGELHLLDLTQLGVKDPTSPYGMVVTDQPVIDFLFFPKEEKLAFLTERGDLYLCDYSRTAQIISSNTLSTEKIQDGVGGIAGISGSQMLFYKGGNTQPTTLEHNRSIIAENQTSSGMALFNLYRISVSDSDQQPVLIDSGICDILDTERDYSSILYTKQSDTVPQSRYSLFSYDSSSEEPITPLATNVAQVVAADATKGTLLYLVPNDQILRYESIFSDDLAESDSKLTDPSTQDLAPEATQEEQQTQLEAVSAYTEKLERDRLRTHLKKEIRDYKAQRDLSYTLYYQPSIAEDAQAINREIFHLQESQQLVKADLEKDYALFVTSNLELLPPTNLSTFDLEDVETMVNEPFDLMAHLGDHLPETLLLYKLSTGESSQIYSELGDRSISSYSMDPDQQKIYFISRPSFTSPIGTLYVTNPNATGVDRTSYIDDGVYRLVGRAGSPLDGLVYQTASRDHPPQYTLYNSASAGVVELSTNTSQSDLAQLVGENNGTLLYFKDYDPIRKVGALYKYTQEELLVATQVHQYLFYNRDQMIVIRRGTNGKLDLLGSKEGSLVVIDSTVGDYHLAQQVFFPSK